MGRDIIKRFRNGFSEELIWFRGTITQLLTAYDDLNTWRLPSPKNKQAWAAVVWKGDPKDRVPHQLIDPTTVPFCVSRAAREQSRDAFPSRAARRSRGAAVAATWIFRGD